MTLMQNSQWKMGSKFWLDNSQKRKSQPWGRDIHYEWEPRKNRDTHKNNKLAFELITPNLTSKFTLLKLFRINIIIFRLSLIFKFPWQKININKEASSYLRY